ncbi:MAG: thioredoxin family protein [Anaerolineae bacterium]|jgi:thioredoxin 1
MGEVRTIAELMQRAGRVEAGAAQPYVLEGRLTLETLLGYGGWAQAWTPPYQPEAQALKALAAQRDAVDLWVFVATWCGDSRREVPRLLWTLSAAGWPVERLHLIGTDWDKRDAEGLAEAWRIERVPTLVVVRGEVELGRVVERAAGLLEVQLARIMAGG